MTKRLRFRAPPLPRSGERLTIALLRAMRLGRGKSVRSIAHAVGMHESGVGRVDKGQNLNPTWRMVEGWTASCGFEVIVRRMR